MSIDKPTPTSAYVDDLLIAANTLEAFKSTMKELLRTLENVWYYVSAKKAQLCQTEVTNLGYILKKIKKMGIKSKKKRLS